MLLTVRSLRDGVADRVVLDNMSERSQDGVSVDDLLAQSVHGGYGESIVDRTLTVREDSDA